MSDTESRKRGAAATAGKAGDERRAIAAREAIAAINSIDARDWWSLPQRRNAVRKALEAL